MTPPGPRTDGHVRLARSRASGSTAGSAALEQALADASARARAAYGAEDTWAEGVRAALATILELLDAEPGLARVLVVELSSAGPAVLARRAELLDELAAVVDRGRASARREPPPLTAQGVLGGALGAIHCHLVNPDGRALRELLNLLMSFIVLPYLGGGASLRELHRPLLAASPRRPRDRAREFDALAGLEMRLTGLTIRVLSAVAGEPGLSNRELSVRAGGIDQGQMSKLLTRLAGLGLIENADLSRGPGVANAWSLTEHGRQLERATRGVHELGTGPKIRAREADTRLPNWAER